MSVGRQVSTYVCARCLQRRSRFSLRHVWNGRSFTQTRQLPQEPRPTIEEEPQPDAERLDDVERPENGRGRMSERLAQMTDESIEQGGQGARKAIKEAGFSDELKRQLEVRIQDSKYKSENPAAFARLHMPSGAGKGTRDIAAAQPWTGSETIEDAALRMLNDAHKPLRGLVAPKIPGPRGPPGSVDMRMKKAVQRSHGERLSSARDRKSIYALSQDPTLSESEREQMRKTLKERFTSGARPMPGSVQGLAALANERIEDAIARGQFKNIARGKGHNVERDHNASSPFLDTTEYFMNRIIQKQDIVPPWIEKQQELVKAAASFRGRLRADWKRHAARVIASKGGSLEAQIRRAEAYAVAEAANNPKTAKVEAISAIDAQGVLSQVTVMETPMPAASSQDSKIQVSEDLAANAPTPSDVLTPDNATLTQSAVHAGDNSSKSVTNFPSPPNADAVSQAHSPPHSPPLPTLAPFRDPAWQSLEHAYHTLAITNLNNLTRSYNLQAPDLAKKPYFSLERELRSCFADIAPHLPHEIRERARRPEKIRVEVVGHSPGGVLDRFSTDKAKVYDSRKPNYGFKQLWKDLWGGGGGEDARA